MIHWNRPDDENTPLLYLGGYAYGHDKYFKALARSRTKYRCVSYKDVVDTMKYKDPGHILRAHENKLRMFLDSGAFNLQKQPDLTYRQVKPFIHGYAKFVQAHREKLDFYAVVDWRKSAGPTYEALQYMRSIGLRPVPVYHGLDSLSHFQQLVDEGYKLIGISLPRVPGGHVRREVIRNLYDAVFNIAEKKGVMLHGLAQTGSLLLAYPWYSADSITWLLVAGMGHIMTVDPRRRKVITIPVSEKIAQANLSRFEETTAHMREWGYTLKELAQDYTARAGFNGQTLIHAVHFKKQLPKWRPTI